MASFRYFFLFLRRFAHRNEEVWFGCWFWGGEIRTLALAIAVFPGILRRLNLLAGGPPPAIPALPIMGLVG